MNYPPGSYPYQTNGHPQQGDPSMYNLTNPIEGGKRRSFNYAPQSHVPGDMYNNQFSMPQQYHIPNPSNIEPKIFDPDGQIPDSSQARIFSDPLLTNVAVQYSSQLVGKGKSFVDGEIAKYIPVNRMKFYFAVDTQYVLQKMKLLLFPFVHSDWSVKYDQEEQLPPRHDVNAPDLYIPAMAYITYVLVAGLVLGIQNRFSPEVLGMLASQAIAWTFAEILFLLCTLYVTSIQTNLKTLDLFAFTGYKFVGIILAVILSLLFHRKGYYLGLIYCSFTLAFFMVKTLKFYVLSEPENKNFGYNMPIKPTTFPTGNKRRMYFMLFISTSQPILMWWLSFHLISD